MMRAPLLLIAGLALAACQSFERSDDGQLCLLGAPLPAETTSLYAVTEWPPPARTLAADVPLVAAVFADFGDCDEDRELRCSVRVDGDRVVISSVRSWTLPPPPNGCLSMVVPRVTTCEVPPLAEGTWQVVYGGQQQELVIPSVVADPCLSSARDAFEVAPLE